jgi:cytochrome c biogenesis protein CcdA
MPLDLHTNSDGNLHQILQAIVTVLAVINPVVCGSIFLTLTPKQTLAQRRRAAVKAALSILIILVISALVGLKILSIFNISLDVFRVVGGMIIAYMGFNMLGGRHIWVPLPDTGITNFPVSLDMLTALLWTIRVNASDRNLLRQVPRYLTLSI